MTKDLPSEELIAVWCSMAEHFLDNDSSDEIPGTAALCLRTGLSIAQARAIWQHDVTPALFLNLWSVAGEWSGWDRDWLVQRIRSSRRRYRGPLAYLAYRVEIQSNHTVWLEIERAMQALLAVPS